MGMATLHPPLSRCAQVLNVFREKEVLALVDHPFIVSLHYAMQTDDYLCLVMDFVAGGEVEPSRRLLYSKWPPISRALISLDP